MLALTELGINDEAKSFVGRQSIKETPAYRNDSNSVRVMLVINYSWSLYI